MFYVHGSWISFFACKFLFLQIYAISQPAP